MILFLMCYKTNRPRYRGKDTTASTLFRTHISGIDEETFGYVSTKNELRQYLASKTLEKGRQNGLHVVVAVSVYVEGQMRKQ